MTSRYYRPREPREMRGFDRASCVCVVRCVVKSHECGIKLDFYRSGIEFICFIVALRYLDNRAGFLSEANIKKTHRPAVSVSVLNKTSSGCAKLCIVVSVRESELWMTEMSASNERKDEMPRLFTSSESTTTSNSSELSTLRKKPQVAKALEMTENILRLPAGIYCFHRSLFKGNSL